MSGCGCSGAAANRQCHCPSPTRRRLDATLLARAEACRAELLCGVAAVRLGLELGDGRRLASGTLLLATGTLARASAGLLPLVRLG